jgi:hypothetical protein
MTTCRTERSAAVDRNIVVYRSTKHRAIILRAGRVALTLPYQPGDGPASIGAVNTGELTPADLTDLTRLLLHPLAQERAAAPLAVAPIRPVAAD